MPRKEVKQAKQTTTGKPQDTGKPTKSWCHGKISFSDCGCLYIKDKDLANEVYWRFLQTGKLCITIPDPNAPMKEINLLCGC